MNPTRDSLHLSSKSRGFSEGHVVPCTCCRWVFVSRHGFCGQHPYAPHPCSPPFPAPGTEQLTGDGGGRRQNGPACWLPAPGTAEQRGINSY